VEREGERKKKQWDHGQENQFREKKRLHRETHRDRGRTNEREKQRVRLLYFAFSSSSRAPSSKATALEIGHSTRETQGRTGEENERTEEWLDMENTNRDTNTENAKNTESKK
jgi:hypothetical protein